MRALSIIVALVCACCVAAAAPAVEYEDFTFAVMGDTRPIGPMNFDLSPAAKRNEQEINWINPAQAFHTGDLVWARG